ncbi:MAG: sigma-54 dependent transcriptional regulator [Bryobacterales bacterium]|nr:sigma-54 dependent transcriptional regulator [Bryobacterales bacterium]
MMRLLWFTSRIAVGLEQIRSRLPGFSVEAMSDGRAGLNALGRCSYDVVLADFPLAGWTAEQLLEELRRASSITPVVIRLRAGSISDAVRLTKLGAFQFLNGCGNTAQLAYVLEAAVEDRRARELALFGQALASLPWKTFMVGESRRMREIDQIVQLAGPRRATVLITGETGTGKEMVARALHMASGRSHIPMVAANCLALPENLLEAELFGHVKGAFTGAVSHRVGRFEQAHGGTLFLDEVGDLPLEIQAKLLRVLQEREFQRLGSSESVKVDVRIVAASNCDLIERMRQARFREDFYYRLNVVSIHVPPLRERLSDIPVLVHHLVDKICRQEELPPKQAPRETMQRLTAYSWPGNVRQLENAIEKAVALSGPRETLYPSDFTLPSRAPAPVAVTGVAPVVALPDDGLDFARTMGAIESQILDQALIKAGGNKKRAADMLRLKRTTLAAKLRSREVYAPAY